MWNMYGSTDWIDPRDSTRCPLVRLTTGTWVPSPLPLSCTAGERDATSGLVPYDQRPVAVIV